MADFFGDKNFIVEVEFLDLCFDIKGGLLGYVLPRFVVAGEAYGFWVNVVDGG